jgi:hypothetical protein
MYGTWAAAIVVIAFLSAGTEEEEGSEDET